MTPLRELQEMSLSIQAEWNVQDAQQKEAKQKREEHEKELERMKRKR